MLKFKFNKQARLSLWSIIILIAIAFSATAQVYNAFPGKYNATLVNVESANVVILSADVYPGYPRNIRVTLPEIAVPVVHSKAPACQIELVQKALDFTVKFMSEAKKIEVRDIKMQSTDQEDAVTHIYTEQGSLARKLKSEGLARPSSVKTDEPWC